MPRPTLADIARRVGCSKYTVSLALREDRQISAATRAKVQDVAKELGYSANATVSHLMAQLRASRTTRFQAKLALINANRDEQALTKHPTIPTYVRGCESLETLPASIGQLRYIAILDLTGCEALESLPEEVACMASLQVGSSNILFYQLCYPVCPRAVLCRRWLMFTAA